MATTWWVTVANGSDAVIGEFRHDQQEAAKAKVFDMITERGVCNIHYSKTAIFEEWRVTPLDGQTFVVYLFGVLT